MLDPFAVELPGPAVIGEHLRRVEGGVTMADPSWACGSASAISRTFNSRGSSSENISGWGMWPPFCFSSDIFGELLKRRKPLRVLRGA